MTIYWMAVILGIFFALPLLAGVIFVLGLAVIESWERVQTERAKKDRK